MLYPDINEYIDLHTHSTEVKSDVFALRNLDEKEIFTDQAYDLPVSAGLHPWMIDKVDPEVALNRIQRLARDPNIVAIGETGLDQTIATPLDIQMKIFISHEEIAESFKKPLIIHCVRAYHLFPGLFERLKPTMPWIFHGFNKNAAIAGELIRKGAYLSIGSALLIDDTSVSKALPFIPPEKIFLETDAGEVPIREIYSQAAKLLSFTHDALKDQIRKNYETVFCSRH